MESRLALNSWSSWLCLLMLGLHHCTQQLYALCIYSTVFLVSCKETLTRRATWFILWTWMSFEMVKTQPGQSLSSTWTCLPCCRSAMVPITRHSIFLFPQHITLCLVVTENDMPMGAQVPFKEHQGNRVNHRSAVRGTGEKTALGKAWPLG
jgi:hypothetical protein